MNEKNENTTNTIISDPYFDYDLCVERLVANWKEHNGIIIAFDYDNTIFDYYNKGYTYDRVIQLLQECKNMGCTLILFSCCDSSKYPSMLNKCKELGLNVDYINKSPENVPFHSEKIYYNILLDDRAGLFSAYNILFRTVQIIKESNLQNNSFANKKTKIIATNISSIDTQSFVFETSLNWQEFKNTILSHKPVKLNEITKTTTLELNGYLIPNYVELKVNQNDDFHLDIIYRKPNDYEYKRQCYFLVNDKNTI